MTTTDPPVDDHVDLLGPIPVAAAEMPIVDVQASVPDDHVGMRAIVLVHEDGRESLCFPLPELLAEQAELGWTPRETGTETTTTTRGRRAGARG